MIPTTSRDLILQALAEFDRAFRGTDEANWEDEQSCNFAIDHEERTYPAKTIVSLATGIAVRLFTWPEARDLLVMLRFRVVSAQRPLTRPVRVWWINQGDSYARERDGGYIQMLKTTRAGAECELQELRIGDVTVHCVGSVVVALGRVVGDAVDVADETPQPKKRKPNKRGRPAVKRNTTSRVAIEYVALGKRVIELEHIAELVVDSDDYLLQFSIGGLRRLHVAIGEPWPVWALVNEPINPADSSPARHFPIERAVASLIDSVTARGVIYEPWQIAAYVTALRTKPFVILAGVSGTGKSRLPREVAHATGSPHETLAVRADWSDSSDLLGYVDLQGVFRPGGLTRAAARAACDPVQFHTCVLDEMNLARVEHYFAEVLSRLERRTVLPDGSLDNEPLLGLALSDSDSQWASLSLPRNLAIVGTVNMDDSTHPFSRKVLDRAFTLELSDIDLESWERSAESPAITVWPAEAWQAGGTSLVQRAEQPRIAERIREIVGVLVKLNEILQRAQLQIAYRSRDEIVQFVLNAAEISACFVDRDGTTVDPLDLALMMKILPRIIGGTQTVRDVLIELMLFARQGTPADRSTAGKLESYAVELADEWEAMGQPSRLSIAFFPRTAARLCLMWQRLNLEGYTSFWL